MEYRKQEAIKAQRVHALECPNFVKHVSSDNCTVEVLCANQSKFAMRHDEWLIKENITQLRQLMSDQNLQLLPDYEQRIAVLKDLGFIDGNSRVELKGKVACEVRLRCLDLCGNRLRVNRTDPLRRRTGAHGTHTRECLGRF